ncbi:hypothetical protein ACFRR7_36840 [Streptomyces sp. NPDC056909]|uniref:hypothetical protein n=1 Tax=Streptomyces sp. NPDC056909 TaxID=3345963 RepID=UPI0036C5AD43
MDHLHTLAEPLTRPVGLPPPADSPYAPVPACADASPTGDGVDGKEESAADLSDTHPAVRALGCLLEYAVSQAPAGGEMPGDVLHLVVGVLAARPGDEAVTEIGARLPVLQRRPARAVPPRPPPASPAVAWLHQLVRADSLRRKL